MIHLAKKQKVWEELRELTVIAVLAITATTLAHAGLGAFQLHQFEGRCMAAYSAAGLPGTPLHLTLVTGAPRVPRPTLGTLQILSLRQSDTSISPQNHDVLCLAAISTRDSKVSLVSPKTGKPVE